MSAQGHNIARRGDKSNRNYVAGPYDEWEQWGIVLKKREDNSFQRIGHFEGSRLFLEKFKEVAPETIRLV
jgi:hypothetical protein